ncbi:MAG: hypothetical protein ABR574_10140 [Cryomorphaceae bacterium]|nr:hypothetical protein [Flavobacteriales bacterium]
MQEIGRVIGKYLIPIVLAVVGLSLLLFSSGQTPLFKWGGLGIFLVGAMGFLFVKGLIPRKIQIILAVAFAGGALVFSYFDYRVIQDEIDYNKKKDKINKHVIQRMKDIRKAQVAYQKEKGKYAGDFDSLLYFLKNEEINLVKRLGTLPDSLPTEEMAREAGIIQKMPEGMTDEQAIEEGLIIRDTVPVEVLGYVFDEDDRKNRKTKLYVDSLPYVPFADHKFEMSAKTIESGGVEQPVFLVVDPDPFDPKEQLRLGSLTEASTSGNWKE